MKKVLFLSVFAGLALMACLDNSVAPGNAGPKGSARIKLPVVPKTALAKSGTSVLGYTFSVTVSGPGMNSRTQMWEAATFGGQTVTLEDIPSGADRVFTGRILLGGTKTHEGSYVVDIGGGESVYVPLVLRDVRSGRAEICMEVEGWSTPKCTPIDTLPVEPYLFSGCWQIEAYDGDVHLSGTLSIIRMEGAAYGTFRTASGFTYFANPQYVNGAWRVNLSPSALVDPGFGLGVIVEDGKDMPAYRRADDTVYLPRDTLIPPPDSVWNRTFHLRIDNVQSGAHAGPLSFLSGVMMDPSFTVVRGAFKGSFTACGEIVIDDPVDTTWVLDTLWARDARKAILPTVDYPLE